MGCLETASTPPLQLLHICHFFGGWVFVVWVELLSSLQEHSCSVWRVVISWDFLEEEPGHKSWAAISLQAVKGASCWEQSSERRFLLVSRPSPRCPCSPAAAVTFLVSGSLSQSLIPGAVKFLLCLNLFQLVSDTWSYKNLTYTN